VYYDQVAEADASVLFARPTTNFGADDTLQTGRGMRSYFRVEVSGQVTRIVLRLFPLRDGAGSKLYLASPGWAESTITWATRPGLGTFLGKTGRVSMGQAVEMDLTSALCGPPPILFCSPGTLDFALTPAGGVTQYASTEHWLMAGPRLVLYVV
jgi:hypothetical protein